MDVIEQNGVESRQLPSFCLFRIGNTSISTPYYETELGGTKLLSIRVLILFKSLALGDSFSYSIIYLIVW